MITPPVSLPRRSSHPLRITRLKLENWKNFSQAEMKLSMRAFLVGPNASGKSNLLDSLRFLKDLARQGGGLQEAVATRGGMSAIRCLAARRTSAVHMTIQLGDDEEPARWTYEIAFNYDKDLRRPAVEREFVRRGDRVVLSRPTPEDQTDRTLLTQTHLEQISANKEFRQIAGFLASIQYRHLVPQIVREPERWRARQFDPFGGDFLQAMADTAKKTREARLRRIAKALRIAAPQLSDLELIQEKGTPHIRGRYEHWRPKGAWQNEQQFSDGTLRLLGLLWTLLEKGGPLLLEEPELSLHPEIVRHIPQLLHRMQRVSHRQAVVSTHSVDLLSDDGIGLEEVFLLIPGREGTSVRTANDFDEIRPLLDGGMTLGEAVLPRTAPKSAEQLPLNFT